MVRGEGWAQGSAWQERYGKRGVCLSRDQLGCRAGGRDSTGVMDNGWGVCGLLQARTISRHAHAPDALVAASR